MKASCVGIKNKKVISDEDILFLLFCIRCHFYLLSKTSLVFRPTAVNDKVPNP